MKNPHKKAIKRKSSVSSSSTTRQEVEDKDYDDKKDIRSVELARSRSATSKRVKTYTQEGLIEKVDRQYKASLRDTDRPPPIDFSTARTTAPMWTYYNPASGIKSKARRHEVFTEWKRAKRIYRDQARQARVAERERLGDAAPPKMKPLTQEDRRVPDLTIVEENDMEILREEEEDEFSDHYKGKTTPKILITTCAKPNSSVLLFISELQALWPHSEFHKRQKFSLKDISKMAVDENFTDLVVITQQFNNPKVLIISHLPKGPTATYRISSFLPAKSIPDVGPRTKHAPELILKNFTTRIGKRISRMMGALFKLKPDLQARGVVTIHNQRDFLFLRYHRYIFDSLSKVRLQELGPRFTLRLRSLQHGLFDTTNGEWEWFYHKKEMGHKDRKTFNM